VLCSVFAYLSKCIQTGSHERIYQEVQPHHRGALQNEDKLAWDAYLTVSESNSPMLLMVYRRPYPEKLSKGIVELAVCSSPIESSMACTTSNAKSSSVDHRTSILVSPKVTFAVEGFDQLGIHWQLESRLHQIQPSWHYQQL
jgi:hypothetical protein